MPDIIIGKQIKERVPETALGWLHYEMKVEKTSGQLLETFDSAVCRIGDSLQVPQIARLPHVESTRRAYKALGKDFHTYRNSAEAMLRRIAGGKGLYRINNAVDINNLISVLSGYSLGSYDVSRIAPRIELLRAPEGAHYKGIGKDEYNIGCLPVLYDAGGPFGNPSSDSERAMVTPGMREILLVIYSFDGSRELDRWLGEALRLLKTYGEGFVCRRMEVVGKEL